LQLKRDIRNVRGHYRDKKIFGSSAVFNWGRTDHGNATKHRNQTEVENLHDTVADVCRIVKKPDAEDSMSTYERIG
jgi:hypothetical protein